MPQFIMKIEVSELSKKQAVENMRSMISSEYFQPYWITGGFLKLGFESMDIVGLKSDTGDFYTVTEFSQNINLLLDKIQEIEVDAHEEIPLCLHLKASDEIKKDYDFSDREMDMKLYFNIKHQPNSQIYNFQLFNIGVRDDKYTDYEQDLYQKDKKVYNQWLRKVRKEFNKIPHKNNIVQK